MEISEKRLNNAKLILEERCAGNKSELARLIGKTPQLLNKWWSDDEAMKRNIGNSSARLIEQAFALPRGWMDERHNNSSDLETDTAKRITMKSESGETYVIPLTGKALLDPQFNLTIINNNKGELMLLSTDRDAFALQLVGHNPNLTLDNGWGLVIEPNTPLAMNEYGLFWLNSGDILLRVVAFQDEESIVIRHPVSGDQVRLDRSAIEKAEYCYVGIPPSKIKA